MKMKQKPLIVIIGLVLITVLFTGLYLIRGDKTTNNFSGCIKIPLKYMYTFSSEEENEYTKKLKPKVEKAIQIWENKLERDLFVFDEESINIFRYTELEGDIGGDTHTTYVDNELLWFEVYIDYDITEDSEIIHVLLHEIGHLLGLKDNSFYNKDSLMNKKIHAPFYNYIPDKDANVAKKNLCDQ